MLAEGLLRKVMHNDMVYGYLVVPARGKGVGPGMQILR